MNIYLCQQLKYFPYRWVVLADSEEQAIELAKKSKEHANRVTIKARKIGTVTDDVRNENSTSCILATEITKLVTYEVDLRF